MANAYKLSSSIRELASASEALLDQAREKLSMAATVNDDTLKDRLKLEANQLIETAQNIAKTANTIGK